VIYIRDSNLYAEMRYFAGARPLDIPGGYRGLRGGNAMAAAEAWGSDLKNGPQ